MKTVRPFDILVPAVAEPEKFAVVSCDQFTSQRDYWDKLDEYVGDAPSALRLIFPEVYLEDGDYEERIRAINAAMYDYLEKGVFETLKDSYILVRRDTAYGYTRLGIVAAVDLEDYSYEYPTDAVIRSTEGVVANRIPPRLKIRKDAPIELPHVMLLLDDRDKTVIEPFYKRRAELKKLYDFDLNMHGGHLTGWQIPAAEFDAVMDAYAEKAKGFYGGGNTMVFAVGDGNHSLATARAHWKEVRKSLAPEEREAHPARYALVEIENLHCDGIVFEPIHRIVFGVDDSDFALHMSGALRGAGRLNMFTTNMKYSVAVSDNSARAIADIQDAVDAYISAHPDASVDYIHGMDLGRCGDRDALHRKGGSLRLCRDQRQPLPKGVLHGGGGRETLLLRGEEDKVKNAKRDFTRQFRCIKSGFVRQTARRSFPAGRSAAPQKDKANNLLM